MPAELKLDARKPSIQIFAASQSEEQLVGFLAELGHDLSKKLKEKGLSVVQVTNITVKDNILNRSSLLFSEGLTGDANVEISDSILNRSEITENPLIEDISNGKQEDQVPAKEPQYSYDVAISYASEDRDVVDQYVNLLLKNNIEVFYDQTEKAFLWGKDLTMDLSGIYERNAKFCVMFISKNYASKWWTERERLAIQMKAVEANSEFVLPIKLDDTEVPGFPPNTIFIDMRKSTINDVVKYTMQKLRKVGK